ncbi:uncharacterized protein B0I36DRAFT_341362 [Microdochium trichocladiopsis]|uniref:BTB domain-containing protein n=1 Tax=Microdochium trichocladiopsis TaxID=1682393 RepID=A0A9P8XQ83_9PEZI|nr:uncharacterized protein B0I36DRAFT_341362 [Microdochium trichocladiopsis]KAH7010870.1 hypothetical protein B0I36DRAFT_341362 [Microdochium trichocladiopsis]
MLYSTAVLEKAYLSWKPVIKSENNYQLRKPKKIRELVRRYASRYQPPEIVNILRSLLERRIFTNEFIAHKAFPDLVPLPLTNNQSTAAHSVTSASKLMLHSDRKSGPMKELIHSMQELHTSGRYSDFSIRSGDKLYRVHKAIVCPRSSFFATACDGPFKEGREGEVDLPEDDPQAVAMMMHYFYYLDYDIPRALPGNQDTAKAACWEELAESTINDELTREDNPQEAISGELSQKERTDQNSELVLHATM